MTRRSSWTGQVAEVVGLEDAPEAARGWRQAVVGANQQGTYGVWTEERGDKARIMIGRHDDQPIGGIPPVIRAARKRAREAAAAAADPGVVVPFSGQQAGAAG